MPSVGDGQRSDQERARRSSPVGSCDGRSPVRARGVDDVALSSPSD